MYHDYHMVFAETQPHGHAGCEETWKVSPLFLERRKYVWWA